MLRFLDTVARFIINHWPTIKEIADRIKQLIDDIKGNPKNTTTT